MRISQIVKAMAALILTLSAFAEIPGWPREDSLTFASISRAMIVLPEDMKTDFLRHGLDTEVSDKEIADMIAVFTTAYFEFGTHIHAANPMGEACASRDSSDIVNRGLERLDELTLELWSEQYAAVRSTMNERQLIFLDECITNLRRSFSITKSTDLVNPSLLLDRLCQ